MTFETFVFRVHAAKRAPKSVEPQQPSNGNETVLLVEDEPTLRELSQAVLTSLGYDVLPARNGVDALRLLKQSRRPVDLVVTDVVMPGMGGPELAVRIREVSPHIRIIFCSGCAQDNFADGQEFEPGINFMQKPYSVAALASQVREALAK